MKGRMSHPARKHVELISWRPDHGTERPIGTFDTIAQPMRYEKSLRILQWHQKSPAIFARRRKSIPCLIFYKYVLCTFIHQKVRHDFGSIDLDHKPQAKQAPRRDPYHGIAFISCWSDSPIHDQELAETFRALQTTRIRNRSWAIVRQFVYYRIVFVYCLTA